MPDAPSSFSCVPQNDTLQGNPFPRNIVILGSTGSIGFNAVREVLDHPDCFHVVAIAANSRIDLLAQQAALLHPDTVITADESRRDALAALAPSSCRVLAGSQPILEMVSRPDVDVVLCAILGMASIRPVLAALAAGKHVALASKEALCMAGDLVMQTLSNSKDARLIPVDSEHSGLFQCLRGVTPGEVSRLWITASGGPFLNSSREEIASATVSSALRHPTWNMGQKISIDSATLMNKALELIEAHYLFGMPGDRLDAVIHPQSKVHALVELTDGTFLAQLSATDMRMAIRYGLSFPQRLAGNTPRLNPLDLSSLDFRPIDETRFPAVALGKSAIGIGGTMPTILTAANDAAVERFLRGEIPLPKIWDIAEKAMNAFSPAIQESPEQLEQLASEIRNFALHQS